MARGRADPLAAAALGSISERGQQQRRLARAVDQRARQFDSCDFPVRSDELDLVALGRGLAGQPPAQVVLHQLDIFRGDEIGQRLADHIDRGHSQHRQETCVGEQDVLPVNQNGVVHRLDQALKQLLAVMEAGRRAARDLEQLIDRADPAVPAIRLALGAEAARRARFARKLRDLAGKVVDGALLAAPPSETARRHLRLRQRRSGTTRDGETMSI